MNITPRCWHVGNTYLFVSHNLAKSSKQWAADYNYNTRHYCIQTCNRCLVMLYHTWRMEMDHLRWCFNKIFTQNVTSKDLSCPNCLSAISEGYKDKISTWGGDVDLLKCLNGFLKKEVKVLFREISLWYCSNLSNKVKHCLHVCNTRHYCIVLLPSHCFTQHYLRFSPCHSIFTQNTAGARQLAAWSYCW